MKLTLEVPLKKAKQPLNYSHKTAFIGSCFSDHIFNRLAYFEFDCIVNPLGTFFHPYSIENFLKLVYKKHRFTSAAVFQHQGIFRCFDAHSKLSATSSEKLVNQLNEVISHTHAYLQQTNFVWISLGSAFVYFHKKENRYVANCHQLPSKEFNKELTSVSDLFKSLYTSVNLLKSLNPSIQVGFTISPVRHVKDGIIENNRSKSHLQVALHDLLAKDPSLNYFPAFEIFQDELRDYRFYASDLVHPNRLGIDYVWEKFKATHIESSVFELMNKIEQYKRGVNHKSRHPESEKHQQFLLFQQRLKKEIDLEKAKWKPT